MTTIITDVNDLDQTKSYTYSDYLTWDFYERTELHYGKIVVLDNTGTLHQSIFGRLMLLLNHYTKTKKLFLYQAPFDVRIFNQSKNIADDKTFTVLQPDFSVFDSETKLEERGGIDAPLLAIEILSPLSENYDNELKHKFEIYEKAGVKEYWIVEPFQKSILIYTLQNDKYIGLKPIAEEGLVHSPLFPELSFNVEEIFRD
jgi:Uma2 family endonuclease